MRLAGVRQTDRPADTKADTSDTPDALEIEKIQ